MKYIIWIITQCLIVALILGCLMGPTPCHGPGDIDMDCDVDTDDLYLLKGHILWNVSVPYPPSCDVNGDGVIGISDIIYLSNLLKGSE